MKVTVFRVENKFGIGPYHGGKLLGRWSDRMHDEHDNDEHPSWYEDLHYNDFLKLRKLGDFVYSSGFISIEHVENWFTGWLIPLSQSGFKIHKYQIEESKIIHCISGKQIIFKKPKK